MKNLVLIAACLFALGFVLINGANNLFPQLFVSVLVATYTVVPAYIKLSLFVKSRNRFWFSSKKWA